MTATAPGAAPRVGAVPGARERILDAALSLMSERGSAATTMRQLAAACRLNVATIYHYFPSKAELLRALIEEQRYDERMAAEQPPIDPDLPAAERLTMMLRWLWNQTLGEQEVLRLLLGEGSRGEATAQTAIRQLVQALDGTLAAWMAAGFPELAERSIDPATAGRLVRRHQLALVAEHLAAGRTNAEPAAAELATALFG